MASGANLRAGTVETLGFERESFDVIILNDVIEHLPDPLGTMRYCASLLAPDGFFVIQTPEYGGTTSPMPI